MNRELGQSASLAGSVAAALAASACCVGPLVFALLGIGGAGALVALEPYRPLLVGVTLGLLGVGFYLTYRRPRIASGVRARPGAVGLALGADLGDDCGCEMPTTHRRGRRLLWAATGLVAVALLFPYAMPYLF